MLINKNVGATGWSPSADDNSVGAEHALPFTESKNVRTQHALPASVRAGSKLTLNPFVGASG